MLKDIRMNVEVKPALWLGVVIKTVVYLYYHNLIGVKRSEDILNLAMKHAFKYRTDNGKWRRLNFPERIAIE